MAPLLDSFKTKTSLDIAGKKYSYFSLKKLEEAGFPLSRLPYSIRILLENLLRCEDGLSVTKGDIEALAKWSPKLGQASEINFMPARVILQDFTGVPAIVDLAAMRDAIQNLGGNPQKINPLQPVELVIDHSVQVDAAGTPEAFKINADLEFERNKERYAFLRWGQKAFNNFKVVPPDTGIVHQVNLEYLARVVMEQSKNGETFLVPDTVVGTDSHTTMINGLGVLGWGVGGIEAEAAMLGQPSTMLIPEVVGFKLTGKLPEGATATDLVLTITQMLRKKGVVGKFVEFFGPGASSLILSDRATIANMAPEYGATCGFFPVDEQTLDYLRLTGRSAEQIACVEQFLKAQGLFHLKDSPEPVFTDVLELDLGTVVPSLAGPSQPHDRVPLTHVASTFLEKLSSLRPKNYAVSKDNSPIDIKGSRHIPQDGDVLIASITSCTNTSNPNVMLMAGLLAKKAVEKGLKAKPWVKTSLAPGSQVVTDYFNLAGLTPFLDALGFHTVGYGCATCIGNSGPLDENIAKPFRDRQLVSASVLSGNRNFEGRIHQEIRANYLASPPLVVAYALAGSVKINLTTEPLGTSPDGEAITLKDIWPTQKEIDEARAKAISSAMFLKRYQDVYAGDEQWRSIQIPTSDTFEWKDDSTYVQNPPYFKNLTMTPQPLRDLVNARVLAVFGDNITTDHISPAGGIKPTSPAGLYLQEKGVKPYDFNSYGARRGNHEVMMRGTFANVRIKNLMLDNIEGGMTKNFLKAEVVPIYDAAMDYQKNGIGLVVLAGKEYGSGSSRDWAAKGPQLLGVKAVIAISLERIHRSNLVGMGVLPLQFEAGQNIQTLGLTGEETITIKDISEKMAPRQKLSVVATQLNGVSIEFKVLSRIDTPVELEYYKHGGILSYVLRQLML